MAARHPFKRQQGQTIYTLDIQVRWRLSRYSSGTESGIALIQTREMLTDSDTKAVEAIIQLRKARSNRFACCLNLFPSMAPYLGCSILPLNSCITFGRRFSYMTKAFPAVSRNVEHGPGGISILLSSFHPLDCSSAIARSRCSTR